MKTYKIFNAKHDISTDSNPCPIYETRCCSSREVAEEIANKEWGAWGAQGHVQEQTIIVFETVEEAEEARQKVIDDLEEFASSVVVD